jgi:hypothetical protein
MDSMVSVLEPLSELPGVQTDVRRFHDLNQVANRQLVNELKVKKYGEAHQHMAIVTTAED